MNTTNTFEDNIGGQVVRAVVNEKNFFSSMKHLFASSFSVVSELMQNARRAGASKVEIHFDAEKKTLVVADDGCGIGNFQDLISFCESGWDEATTLSDRPFGMGFFSAFFAAETLTVRSAGKILQASLNDITSKRAIVVRDDPTPVLIGTCLEFTGLSKELLGTGNGRHTKSSTMQYEVESFAKGFEIPVFFNETEVARPHALQNIAHATTRLGAISVAHVHRKGNVDQLSRWKGGNSWRLYLQGLPIEVVGSNNDEVIVHLDTQVFQPVMPDRKYLYDAVVQLDAIRDEIKRIIAQFLAEQKSAMDGKEFVLRYMSLCLDHGCSHLLNDIPWLPKDCFDYVGEVQYRGTLRPWYMSNDYGSSVERDLYSRDEIADGRVQVWRDVSDDVVDDIHACAILKYMQRMHVIALRDSLRFGEGHWIMQSPSCLDMQVEVIPSEWIACELAYVDYYIPVHLVNYVEIKITSSVNSIGAISHILTDDWVMVGGLEDGLRRCYITKYDKSSDHPVRALSDFEDDSDTYIEAWEDEATSKWNALVAGLRGSSLAEQLAPAIRSAPHAFQAVNQGQLVLTTLQTKLVDGEYRTSPDLRVFDLEVEKTWVKFAELVIEQCGANVDHSRLKELFVQATGASALQDKSEI